MSEDVFPTNILQHERSPMFHLDLFFVGDFFTDWDPMGFTIKLTTMEGRIDVVLTNYPRFKGATGFKGGQCALKIGREKW